jgi:hypothetical protein
MTAAWQSCAGRIAAAGLAIVSGMAIRDDVRLIALALPETVERSSQHGVLEWRDPGILVRVRGSRHADRGSWRERRDIVERSLTEPRQAHGRFGDHWEEPAVSEAFHPERVELRGTEEAPEIAVLFRWFAEDDLFGLSFPISQGHELDDAPDAYLSVYVEENLLAAGFGLANAIREPAAGVTWLRWRGR